MNTSERSDGQKHIGFELPVDEARRLRELAERDERTLSNFLRKLVRERLAKGGVDEPW